MKVAIFLLCLIVSKSSGSPRPCDLPEQWEGVIYRTDKTKPNSEFGSISYDWENQRMRFLDLSEGGDNLESLYLYGSGLVYRQNPKTGDCTFARFNEPLESYNVPELATMAFEDEQTNYVTWEGVYTDGREYEITVTDPACLPVYHQYYSNMTDLVTTNFFDVTGGIADLSVFDPPSGCVDTEL